MPSYKAKILNKEIILNYEVNEKEKLEESIKLVNLKLNEYHNLNGKISDSHLLSFLAIKLQAEIIELKKNNIASKNLENEIEDTKQKNIMLNDKLHKLNEKNSFLDKENDFIKNDLEEIQNQIEKIIGLIKRLYED